MVILVFCPVSWFLTMWTVRYMSIYFFNLMIYQKVFILLISCLSSLISLHTTVYFVTGERSVSWHLFPQMLIDSSHILAVSMDKRISFPLRFFLTAQEFGMVVCTKQMTFLTLDVECLYFLTHSWTMEFFSHARLMTYRWLWQIQ